MSRAVQDLRERIAKGDTVHVVTRYGAGLSKHKPAVVRRVMRAGLSLDIEGEAKPRTVRFADIELIEAADTPRVGRDATKPAAPVAPERAPTKPAAAVTVGGQVAESVQWADATRERMRAATAPADVDAWLSMGREMLEPLRVRVRDLAQRIEAIEADRAALDVERAGAESERAETLARIERIEALVGPPVRR